VNGFARKEEIGPGLVFGDWLDVQSRLWNPTIPRRGAGADARCFSKDVVPYAVIGGNAVAAWVATIDDGAVRNTRDVDLLLEEADLPRATVALEGAGFVRDQVLDTIIFLDGPAGKPSQGLHILLAGRKVKLEYATAAPSVEQTVEINQKRIVELAALVEMKLNSYRDKDRTHLRDLIQVGMLDTSWLGRLPSSLAPRLKTLLDNPEG